MKFLKFLIFFLIPLTLLAESPPDKIVGHDSKYWNFTSREKWHDSVVKVHTPKGSGTGVVVKTTKPVTSGGRLGYVLTAHHVVEGYEKSDKLKIHYLNIKSKDNKVVASDEIGDFAIIHCWVPENVEAIKIAENNEGVFFYAAGLGGHSKLKNLRTFGDFTKLQFPSNNKQVYFNCPVIPGDSGAPITNFNGEIISVISGGWTWFEDKRIIDANGNWIATTYPMRGGSFKRLKKILEKIKDKQ